MSVTSIDLHDKIVAELFAQKSLAALLWLVDNGRELEFSYQGQKGFISKSNSQKFVSLWQGEAEQAFEHTEQLLASAVVGQERLLDVWAQVQLDCLF